MHIYTCTRTHDRTHSRTHTCPATHAHTRVPPRTHARMQHIRTCVRTCAHTHIDTHIGTNTRTQARTCNLIKHIIITMLTKLIRFQGKLEERNPFVSIRLPPSFEKDYPTAAHNLRTNSRRLTSPFDIHATFLDILNYTTVLHGNLSHVCILVR